MNEDQAAEILDYLLEAAHELDEAKAAANVLAGQDKDAASIREPAELVECLAFGQFARRGVKGLMIPAAARPEDEIETIRRVHFVNQHVASLAGFGDGLAGSGVAGDDNRAPGSIDGVTECLRP